MTTKTAIVLGENTRLIIHSIFDGRVIALGVGFIAEGDSGRQEFDGPLVPGPWAYTYAVPVIIDAAGSRAARRPAVKATAGDLVVVDGRTYKITPGSRRERPDLAAV